MAEQKVERKFPTEIIDLPTGGKLYPEGSPLREGKIEIKYMTAKEEDILTSQNLIKKGLVIEKLLDSLILTKGVKSEDLVIGDKNAVMVASRILAYGPEYTCEVTHPRTEEQREHTFNLADCPFKETPKDIDLHIIVDNYSTHKHKKVNYWLAKKPRVHLHFIPTSSSWINLVERFFALITEKQLRRGVFRSVEQLENTIYTLIEKRNQKRLSGLNLLME